MSFLVVASSSLPLEYRWRKDGTDLSNGGRIAGVDTAELRIGSLVPSDTGTYSARLTTAGGSIISAPADLTVLSDLPPPTGPALFPDLLEKAFRVSFASEPGVTYILQAASDLTPSVVWDSLAITEYLAERHPGVWPRDPRARAFARCAAAEIHAEVLVLLPVGQCLHPARLRSTFGELELHGAVRPALGVSECAGAVRERQEDGVDQQVPWHGVSRSEC